jgi:23S rRNA (cytidine2498-2'-O)-methyltransferase
MSLIKSRLHLARLGFAGLIAREATDAGLLPTAQGETWLLTPAPEPASPAAYGLCFAHSALIDPVELRGGSVNAATRAALDWFLASCRGERFEQSWPLQFRADESIDGLARRVTAVEREFSKELTKRLARVAHLARPSPSNPRGPARGLFLFFRDFDAFRASREAVLGGQRRMADDPGAPSRSYLKVEEAYGILGQTPHAGETVVDLGAAPGGWSYSAAKHGASVLALDNGPLKGAALGHPLIRHEQADAFRHTPPPGTVYDWLFCDVVDDPVKVLGLLEHWVAQRWCRRFVVNLKFGRTDPLPLLRRATGPGEQLPRACSVLWARHLFHDREEFTLVGELRA